MKSLFLALSLLLAGCTYLPLRPGHAYLKLPDGSVSEVKQSQNPKDATTQIFEQTGTNGVTTKVTTSIGASQKDTARELAAKLSSLSFVVWIGVALFVFGAVSAFYPPLKLIVGSLTTSAIIAVAGLTLTVLPVLVVGHEVLILSVAAGVILLYWFAHRHGSQSGILATLKEQLANTLNPPTTPPAPPVTK